MTKQECKEALLSLRDCTDVWGGKWKISIMLYLVMNKSDKKYFMQIKRDLTGISAKILSKELKDLEINKLVKRTVHQTKPITVEYEITEHGKTFVTIAKAIIRWGIKHREIIKTG